MSTWFPTYLVVAGIYGIGAYIFALLHPFWAREVIAFWLAGAMLSALGLTLATAIKKHRSK